MINLKDILNEKLARGLKPLLVIGTTITKKTGEETLVKLSDKFDRIDDEDAGDIASHLDMAIELMQDGYPGDATKMLKQFNKKCKDVLKGKPIASVFEGKMNEAKEYKAGDTVKLKTGGTAEINQVVKGPRVELNTYRAKIKGKQVDFKFSDISENKIVKEEILSEADYGKPYKKGEKIKTKDGFTLKVLKVKKGQDLPQDEYVLQYLDGKSKGQKFEMWHYMLHNRDLGRHPGYKPKGPGRGIKEGFADKYKNKSEMSPLTQYCRAFMDWLWATQEDALDVAGNYEDQDEPKLAKDWIQFSTILIVAYKKLKNFDEKFAARTKAVLPTSLQKKLDNAKFHKGPTTEDNYKKVLKEVLMLVKEIEKVK